MTWAQSLEVNDTDGIIVLHKGTIIYEHYSGCLNTLGQHGSMSVTKSITGLLGEVLVAESILDEAAKVSTIVPELADSAFGDATIRQVMDMTTGLQFSEDYTDPNADVWIYSASSSPLPKPEAYQGSKTYYEYLQTVRKQGEHGAAFGYKTIIQMLWSGLLPVLRRIHWRATQQMTQLHYQPMKLLPIIY